MLETTLEYLAQIFEIGPPAVIIEVFPRNESDGTRFFKFHYKRIPSKATSHPRLLLLVCKNIIFCYNCKVFGSGYPLAQHSVPLLSAGTIHSYQGLPDFFNQK